MKIDNYVAVCSLIKKKTITLIFGGTMRNILATFVDFGVLDTQETVKLFNVPTYLHCFNLPGFPFEQPTHNR